MEPLLHRIDPVACLSTAAMYLLCSFVLSPLLVNSSNTVRKYLNRNRQYQLLGHFFYSVVTTCLAVHIIFTGNMVKKAKSAVGFFTIEVSFSYFVTDLFTTLLVFRDTISGEQMNFLHHVAASVGLLVGLYSQGAALVLCVLRLFSQLSTPFLVVRLLLLGGGWKESGLFLVNMALVIVTFFVGRIAITPWYWKLYVDWMFAPETPLLACAVLGAVSVVLDILNVCWLYSMIVKFVEYVKAMREKHRTVSVIT